MRQPTKRAPDAGDSAAISSIFTRLSLFLAGRLRRPRPSAGNANRWAAGHRESKMKNKIIVKAETTSFAYVTLYNAAFYSLQAAKDSVDGRFFNCLTAMVFSAFSLEAYLNHLGTSEFPNWVKIERSKSPKQKLELLTEKIAFSSDFSKPPFETFDKIFKFRKQIAHGKTERVRVEEVQDVELGDKPKLPHTSWEIETNLENATAFVEDTKSIIQILHPKFGYQTNAFFTEWHSSWEAKPYESDQ